MFFFQHHRHYIKAKLKAKTALAEVSHYSGYNMMNTHLTLVLSGIVIKTVLLLSEEATFALIGTKQNCLFFVLWISSEHGVYSGLDLLLFVLNTVKYGLQKTVHMHNFHVQCFWNWLDDEKFTTYFSSE